MNSNEQILVLVVDDDSGHQTTLKTIIKSWGYQVEVANDGSEAVEKVKEIPFDLILMDVKMAVMSGIEALHDFSAHLRGYLPQTMPVAA